MIDTIKQDLMLALDAIRCYDGQYDGTTECAGPLSDAMDWIMKAYEDCVIEKHDLVYLPPEHPRRQG